MQIDDLLRKLAKSIEQQNLFIASKEINGIKLFENDTELSKLQHLYLSYLYFYSDLYTDIALKKVIPNVLVNFIREDSYSYYKRNKEPEIDKKNKKNDIHLIFKDPKEIKNLKTKKVN